MSHAKPFNSGLTVNEGDYRSRDAQGLRSTSPKEQSLRGAQPLCRNCVHFFVREGRSGVRADCYAMYHRPHTLHEEVFRCNQFHDAGQQSVGGLVDQAWCLDRDENKGLIAIKPGPEASKRISGFSQEDCS